MKLTSEQDAAIARATSTTSNLLLSALAGCAKTTTLEEIIKALGEECLYLCFNKRTAVEAAKRLPSFVEVKTLNALGHRAWMQKTGRKRLRVSASKTYFLCKELFPEGDIDYRPLLKAAMRAKVLGKADNANFSYDISWSDLAEDCDEDDLRHLMKMSAKAAFDGNIDFADQIYMSVCFAAPFTKHSLVFVDECQDLSQLNILMLKAVIGQRLIAVGDEKQSIYAFRGAHSGALAQLKDTYSMTTLPLTVNFRCSRAVVEYAQSIVPQLKPRPDAPLGFVKEGEETTLSQNYPPGSAILCRNNAPLFRMGLMILRNGRGVCFLGANAVQSSIKSVLALIDTNDPTAALKLYEEAQRRKLKGQRLEALDDKLACVRELLKGTDVAGATKKLDALCSRKSAEITLATGHKAKGLEWDDVFILNRDLIPSPYAKTPEALQQESNLMYVMQTRARENLYFITNARAPAQRAVG